MNDKVCDLGVGLFVGLIVGLMVGSTIGWIAIVTNTQFTLEIGLSAGTGISITAIVVSILMINFFGHKSLIRVMEGGLIAGLLVFLGSWLIIGLGLDIGFGPGTGLIGTSIGFGLISALINLTLVKLLGGCLENVLMADQKTKLITGLGMVLGVGIGSGLVVWLISSNQIITIATILTISPTLTPALLFVFGLLNLFKKRRVKAVV